MTSIPPADSVELVSGTMADDDLSDLALLEAIPTQELVFQREEPASDVPSMRFGSALSGEELKKKLENSIPKRTKENNNWALKLYKEWRTWRNFTSKSKQDPNWPIPALDRGEKVKLNFRFRLRFLELFMEKSLNCQVKIRSVAIHCICSPVLITG